MSDFVGIFSVVTDHVICTDGQTAISMGIPRGYEQH